MKYLLLTIAVLAAATAAFADGYTLDPVADAPVDSTHANTNYGDMTYGYWGRHAISRTLVKWDLSSLAGETVTDAQIKFSLFENYEGGNDNMQVRRVTATWDEMTVTWNNQPAYQTTGPGLMLDESWVSGLGPHTLDLKDDHGVTILQDWIDNPGDNYGVILLRSGEGVASIPRCLPWTKEQPGEPGVQLLINGGGASAIETASLGNIKAVFR